MSDARFEDGAEKPLRLLAETAEDIPVLSTLLQDALGQPSEMKWQKGRRRFAMLFKRFRWEDREMAHRMGRGFERVQSMLVIDDVRAVRSSGVDAIDREVILSVLSLAFTPGEDGTGTLLFTLSGDGEIAVDVEAVNLRLADVTRPYLAPTKKAPDHGVD